MGCIFGWDAAFRLETIFPKRVVSFLKGLFRNVLTLFVEGEEIIAVGLEKGGECRDQIVVCRDGDDLCVVKFVAEPCVIAGVSVPSVSEIQVLDRKSVV